MDDFQAQFSNGLPTIDGFTGLKQTLNPYVTQSALEFQLQEFAQNVETGTFTLPNPTEYFQNKRPDGNIDMNGKRITNLDTSIDLSSGIAGVASTALSLGIASQMFPNTGPQNLTENVSMGNKRLTVCRWPQPNEPLANLTQQETDFRNNQAVTQGFMREQTLAFKLRRGDQQEILGNQPTNLPFDAFQPSSQSETGVRPLNIQGVADPIYNYDAVNKKTMDEEIKGCYQRDADLDVQDQYRMVNMPDPTASQHSVNKRYCDGNSKNGDGSGLITGLLGGALGGAVGSMLATFVGQGFSAIGQLAGAGAGLAGAALGGAMKLGSTADFNRYQPSAGETQQMIDNLKDDVANRPNGAADAGSLLNGAMSVSGLFRAVQNAQIGIFDLVN